MGRNSSIGNTFELIRYWMILVKSARIRAMRPASRECYGFTYIGLLIFIALLSIALAGVGTMWSTQKKRERERQLLFVGEQYRRAISDYYEHSQGAKQYPRTIDDLLLDQRFPNVQRYLRQPYADPITGKSEWGLVTGPEGRIVGVYSMSKTSPLQRTNFKSGFENLEGAEHYSDWKFVYIPAGTLPAQPPAPTVTGSK